MRSRSHLDQDTLIRPAGRRWSQPRRTGVVSRGSALALCATASWALASCEPAIDENAAFVRADSIVDAWVAADRIAGAVLVVLEEGNTVHEYERGVLQRYAYGSGQYPTTEEPRTSGLVPATDTIPVTVDTYFDMASVTKVLATTMAVMLLVDRGDLELDAPLPTILPDFVGDGRSEITVRHLLTHTSGLPQWWPVYYHAPDREAAWSWLRAQIPVSPVGEERHYSDLGFMTLGRVVEVVSGEPLDRFLANALYEPIGLDAHFRPANGPAPPGPVAATSHGNPFERRMVHDAGFGYRIDLDAHAWSEWRQHTLVGEVNDGNAWHAFGGVAGHAGLFASASDAAALVHLLLSGGSANGAAVIRPETVASFLEEQLPGQALGWQLPEYAPPGSFGHSGFTGTFVLGVPSEDLVIVLLTNRQNPGVDDETQYTDVGPLQRAVVDALTTNRTGG